MRSNTSENSLCFFEVAEHRIAEHHITTARLIAGLRARLRTWRAEIDKLSWSRHRKRPQKHLVEDRENCGGRSDAQRERNDRDDCDRRRFSKRSEGELD